MKKIKFVIYFHKRKFNKIIKKKMMNKLPNMLSFVEILKNPS